MRHFQKIGETWRRKLALAGVVYAMSVGIIVGRKIVLLLINISIICTIVDMLLLVFLLYVIVSSFHTHRWSVYASNRTCPVAIGAHVTNDIGTGVPDVGVIPPIMN